MLAFIFIFLSPVVRFGRPSPSLVKGEIEVCVFTDFFFFFRFLLQRKPQVENNPTENRTPDLDAIRVRRDPLAHGGDQYIDQLTMQNAESHSRKNHPAGRSKGRPPDMHTCGAHLTNTFACLYCYCCRVFRGRGARWRRDPLAGNGVVKIR